MDVKRYCVPLVLLGALTLTGCPDGTPGKETAKNSWEDMLDELRKMDEASMKKHWKRYYQKAIADLQNRVKELKEKKVEIATSKKLKENDLNELKAKSNKGKELIKKSIAKYKAQKKEKPDRKTYNISLNDPTEELSEGEAKKRLVGWTREWKRKYAPTRLKNKIDLVKQLTANLHQIDAAIEQYENKIQMLKDQMEEYEVKLEMAKVRESMTALATSGKELSASTGIPSMDQLGKLNKSLDKAITKSEVRAQLADEDKKLEGKKQSLEDAMKKVSVGTEVSDLEKELDGL